MNMNYFYNLPEELQENVYFQEHKMKLKESLFYVEIIPVDECGHRYMGFGARQWYIQDELEDEDKENFLQRYWNVGKCQDILRDNYDCRINIRRHAVLDSKTWLETWKSLGRDCTVVQLKKMGKQNGVERYSKLNKKELIRLLMTR